MVGRPHSCGYCKQAQLRCTSAHHVEPSDSRDHSAPQTFCQISLYCDDNWMRRQHDNSMPSSQMLTRSLMYGQFMIRTLLSFPLHNELNRSCLILWYEYQWVKYQCMNTYELCMYYFGLYGCSGTNYLIYSSTLWLLIAVFPHKSNRSPLLLSRWHSRAILRFEVKTSIWKSRDKNKDHSVLGKHPWTLYHKSRF